MKLIVAGSRTVDDYSAVEIEIVERFHVPSLHIISGGAKGADRLAERFAYKHGLPIDIVPAEWDTYGKSAGYRRNQVMAAMGDELIAFWDGHSKGTKHMIDIALSVGIPVTIITMRGESE